MGSHQRTSSLARPAAGRFQGRLLGRLGRVSQAGFARVHERLSRVRGPAARVVRRWLHDAGRQPLGSPGVAARAAEPRARPLEAAPGLVGAPTEPLERRAAQARAVDELGLQQAVRPPLRAPHVPRPAGLRVPRVGRAPGRRLRPQHLRRHVQLGLRAGLEAGEQLPLAPRYGRLLLRLLPARPVPGLPSRRAPSGREGRALPGDRRRPGRAPRRDVGRRGTGAYDEALDRQLADAQRALYGADTRCKPV